MSSASTLVEQAQAARREVDALKVAMAAQERVLDLTLSALDIATSLLQAQQEQIKQLEELLATLLESDGEIAN